MRGVGTRCPPLSLVSWLPDPGAAGSCRGTPSLRSGAAGGPGTTPAPPPLRLLPPGVGGGRTRDPGGLGRGGEGKEVGLWRRDPMSPKNVPRSQPF